MSASDLAPRRQETFGPMLMRNASLVSDKQEDQRESGISAAAAIERRAEKTPRENHNND